MNLVVFDIDGTLVRSVELDDTCFVRAFADVLGIEGISTDWSRYRHSTDSGLAREIVRRHLGRDPLPEEIDSVRERCCQLLRKARLRHPGAIRPVEGAAALLAHLDGQTPWRAAIASGSWPETARIKLEAAGLAVEGLPGAFADTALERCEILGQAVARAAQRYARAGFSKVVYVGDGPWDVETARRLQIAFVGIAGRQGAERLLSAGAATVLSSFEPLASVVAALEDARVPQEDRFAPASFSLGG